MASISDKDKAAVQFLRSLREGKKAAPPVEAPLDLEVEAAGAQPPDSVEPKAQQPGDIEAPPPRDGRDGESLPADANKQDGEQDIQQEVRDEDAIGDDFRVSVSEPRAAGGGLGALRSGVSGRLRAVVIVVAGVVTVGVLASLFTGGDNGAPPAASGQVAHPNPDTLPPLEGAVPEIASPEELMKPEVEPAPAKAADGLPALAALDERPQPSPAGTRPPSAPAAVEAQGRQGEADARGEAEVLRKRLAEHAKAIDEARTEAKALRAELAKSKEQLARLEQELQAVKAQRKSKQPAARRAVPVRPRLAVLAIAVPAGCEPVRCTPVATIRYKGRTHIVPDGDTFVGYRVSVLRDRISLARGGRRYTYFLK